MGDIRKVTEGLLILSAYYDDRGDAQLRGEGGGKCCCSPSGSRLRAFATDQPISDADVARLEALGWKQRYVVEWTANDYLPDSEWVCEL